MPGLTTQPNGGTLSKTTLATINTLAAGIFPTQGNIFFVNPQFGNDNNSGTRDNPLQTLARALALATAGQNDIIYLEASSNTASLTSAYQASTLNWNKDMVHLIGINAGPLFSQRSRIAWLSTYTGTSNLFTLSASGCLIWNIEMFAGVASANPVGGMLVTGERNHVLNCHIAGIGNTLMDTTTAYSVNLSGASENLFEDCTIGLDTVSLSAAANAQIITSALAGVSATRNWFRRCRVLTYAGAAAENLFLRVPATTIDRFLAFEDTVFINPVASGATNLTEAAIISSTAGGAVLLIGTTAVLGASGWNSTASGNVYAMLATPTNSTFGLAVAVTST